MNADTDIDTMKQLCECGECRPCRRAFREIDRDLKIPLTAIVDFETKKKAEKKTQATKSTPIQKKIEPVLEKKVATTSIEQTSESPSEQSDVVSAKRSRTRDSKAYQKVKQQRRDQRKSERILIDGCMVHPKKDLKHGTATAYVDHCCRCPDCKAYTREISRRYRKAKEAKALKNQDD